MEKTILTTCKKLTLCMHVGTRLKKNHLVPTISTMDRATGINIIVVPLLFIGILEQGNNLFSSQVPNWERYRFTECIKSFDFQLKDHLGNPLCGLKFQIK